MKTAPAGRLTGQDPLTRGIIPGWSDPTAGRNGLTKAVCHAVLAVLLVVLGEALISTVVALPSMAQTAPSWTQPVPGPGQLTTTSDGTVVAQNCASGNSRDQTLTAVRATGPAWSYTAIGCAASDAPQVDNQGNSYEVVGASVMVAQSIVKLDSSGAIIWTATLPVTCPSKVETAAGPVVVGTDGNIYLERSDTPLQGCNGGTVQFLDALRASDGHLLFDVPIPYGLSELTPYNGGLAMLSGDYQIDRYSYAGIPLPPLNVPPVAITSPFDTQFSVSADGQAAISVHVHYDSSDFPSNCSGGGISAILGVNLISGTTWQYQLPAAPMCTSIISLSVLPDGGIAYQYATGPEAEASGVARIDGPSGPTWQQQIVPSAPGEDIRFPDAMLATDNNEVVTVSSAFVPCGQQQICTALQIDVFDGATGSDSTPTILGTDGSVTESYGDANATLDTGYVYMNSVLCPGAWFGCTGGSNSVFAVPIAGLGALYPRSGLLAAMPPPTPVVAVSVSPAEGQPGTDFTATDTCPSGLLPNLTMLDKSGNPDTADVQMGLPVSGDGQHYTQDVLVGPEGSYTLSLSCGRTTTATTPFTVKETATYAALGDSFASGEGASSFYPATNQPGINMCHRATTAYALTVSAHTGDPLDFAACSGAIIEDFNQWNPTNAGEIPQIDHVSPLTTKLVTVSIGGNNIGFPDVLADCIVGTGAPGKPGCQSRDATALKTALGWLENGRPATPDCHNLPGINPATGKPDSVCGPAPSLSDLYVQIAEQMAHGGQLVVVSYPQLFGTDFVPERIGKALHFGCPVDVAGLYNIGMSDVLWLNQEAVALNSVIARSVGDARAKLVKARSDISLSFVQTSASFAGHRLCDSYVPPPLFNPWINYLTLMPTTTFPFAAPSPISFHPNNAGQTQYGKDVDAVIP